MIFSRIIVGGWIELFQRSWTLYYHPPFSQMPGKEVSWRLQKDFWPSLGWHTRVRVSWSPHALSQLEICKVSFPEPKVLQKLPSELPGGKGKIAPLLSVLYTGLFHKALCVERIHLLKVSKEGSVLTALLHWGPQWNGLVQGHNQIPVRTGARSLERPARSPLAPRPVKLYLEVFEDFRLAKPSQAFPGSTLTLSSFKTTHTSPSLMISVGQRCYSSCGSLRQRNQSVRAARGQWGHLGQSFHSADGGRGWGWGSWGHSARLWSWSFSQERNTFITLTYHPFL